ncbi:hypothetical protein PMKS-001593 [Pichia membranifaciens]|uniref:Rho termination factor N-terminal domain-containing protein n=1 Tax=Pichia membranifaciens TaxID=4926 RepID=A0A1Q2YF55_9ASCO|nr:hypothetical protein PMKS-001593 [Pichia membranifaciens]
MSTLSKKTKGQLVEIAQDLDIDIAECKVKKDVYEAVRDYFISNSEKFDENSKYYELAVLSKFGSPKKTVFIESENGDVKEVDVAEEDDDETEEAEDNEDGDADEDDDEDEDAEDDDDEDEDAEDDEDEDDDEDDDDFDFECYTSLVKAIQHGTVSEYLELKNYELRDYLGDPYTINELTFSIETAVLLYRLISLTTLDTYLPSSVLKYLPAFAQTFPVISASSFNLANAASLFLWLVSAKALPLIFSYYVNFTYDFDRDAFTESLAKLFLAIIVFKSDFTLSTVGNEIKYAFRDNACEAVKHYAFVATLKLKDTFQNWVLINALFTSILSLYANLAFV